MFLHLFFVYFLFIPLLLFLFFPFLLFIYLKFFFSWGAWGCSSANAVGLALREIFWLTG
jgi:hypothetical protein